jgi:hypothetical protein
VVHKFARFMSAKNVGEIRLEQPPPADALPTAPRPQPGPIRPRTAHWPGGGLLIIGILLIIVGVAFGLVGFTPVSDEAFATWEIPFLISVSLPSVIGFGCIVAWVIRAVLKHKQKVQS